MADWMVWLILAGVLIGLEIFTGTFYLLMLGVGFAAGGVAALLGSDKALQFFIAAVFGVLATVLLRKGRIKRLAHNTSSDPNVNLDIGQTITVNEWKELGGGNFTSRAMYRGTMWDVDLMQGAFPNRGVFIIREVRGSRLLVSNYSIDDNREKA